MRDSVGYCTTATWRVSWASSRTLRLSTSCRSTAPVEEALDRPALGHRQRLDGGQPVDEEAVALVGGHPAGAGVRLGDVALLLQHRHVVADGGRGDAEVVPLGEGLAADRVVGRDVVLDDGPEDLQAAFVVRHGDTSPYRSTCLRCWHSGLGTRTAECQPAYRPVPPHRAGSWPALTHAGRPGYAPRRRIGWAGRRPERRRAEVGSLIFKAVRDGRPYPDHGLSTRDWAMIPPRQVRMDTLMTTKRELGARRAARRGLDVLRRPVPARRAVARRAVPRGRPAPGAARGPAAAQRHPRPGARPGRGRAGAGLTRTRRPIGQRTLDPTSRPTGAPSFQAQRRSGVISQYGSAAGGRVAVPRCRHRGSEEGGRGRMTEGPSWVRKRMDAARASRAEASSGRLGAVRGRPRAAEEPEPVDPAEGRLGAVLDRARTDAARKESPPPSDSRLGAVLARARAAGGVGAIQGRLRSALDQVRRDDSPPADRRLGAVLGRAHTDDPTPGDRRRGRRGRTGAGVRAAGRRAARCAARPAAHRRPAAARRARCRGRRGRRRARAGRRHADLRRLRHRAPGSGTAGAGGGVGRDDGLRRPVDGAADGSQVGDRLSGRPGAGAARTDRVRRAGLRREHAVGAGDQPGVGTGAAADPEAAHAVPDALADTVPDALRDAVPATPTETEPPPAGP